MTSSSAAASSEGPGPAAAQTDAMAGAGAAGERALRQAAWRIRRRAVDMVALEGFGYLGQALSSAELAAVLYLTALRIGYDRLVVSPGHYSIVHFAAGVEVGLIDEAELSTYGKDGSRLEAIGTEDTPGLAATCGSLGQGLSVAAGIALAQRLAASDRHVYVLMSDGEMEEGQVWEAALFCAHHRLGNINPALYDLGALSQSKNSPFHTGIVDITTGNNSFGNVTGYTARPGYDLASGWGTIDAAPFVHALAQLGGRS